MATLGRTDVSPRVSISLVLLSMALAAGDAPTPNPADPPEPTWTVEQRSHWSFAPPKRPTAPEVKNVDWVRTPIDAFILREIEAAGLEPTPEADRVSLIRRLSFDLNGLPPTPEDVAAFVADERGDAYERLVDRLLSSPRYGERWANPWLDLARYAESDGFKSDKTRPSAWRYRDWVIKALNDDMPYDRFARLQLAGDEFAPGDHDAFIATGFNRNWPYEDNNKVPGQNRQLMLEDMTDTTASVFLGLTLACARCHNHKYDPISQKDYYRFQALFAASTPKDDRPLATPFVSAVQDFVERAHQSRVKLARRALEAVEHPYAAKLLEAKLAKLPNEVRQAFETEPEERSAFQEDLLAKHAKDITVDAKAMRTAMKADDLPRWELGRKTIETLAKGAPAPLSTASGMTDAGHNAPPVFLLAKGNFTKPGAEVAPGFLSVLGPTSLKQDSTGSDASETSGRRRSLAEWLTDPSHPLTARVIVNRLWQGHFGRGIVATPSDFGTQGTAPTHPELLDWLATELVKQEWSLKAIHRLMVMSATYRQASFASPGTRELDPDNALFSRMFRRRLEAEAVRDALLAVSGRLDTRVGGPSVFPDLPAGVQTRGGWTRSESASDRNRRSVYVFVRRNLKYPLFDAFDAPDTNVTCPERNVSVNAPQALTLLNSNLVVEYAKAMATRIRQEAGEETSPEATVQRAYALAFSRTPDATETARGISFLKAAKDEASELEDFCHALINLNEFVFVD
jgi:Protein of unknown function (DUF1553)/Protein of unknown function (DUF1549)